jgi:hypothetical protein
MVDDARGTTLTHPPGNPRVPSELLARIRAEYREMPGLCLTPAQAARLWGLAPGACADVLQALVVDGTLTCTRDVRYVAAATGPAPRRRPRREWAPRGAA